MSLKTDIDARTSALSAVLTAVNTAITGKGGQAAANLSGVPAAIGGIRNLRTETGTVTPTAASDTLTLPCSVNVRLAVVTSVFGTATGIVGCVYMDKSALGYFAEMKTVANTNTVVYINGNVGRGANNASDYDGGLNLNSGSRNWIAGLQYTWTAYYWDD